MKASTRQTHAARVDAVLARLQSALAQGEPVPAFEELAGLAHVSPFHFHRVWRALTGEAPGRTVARLRLLRALQLLEEGRSAITTVALASGYDSAQSLARASRTLLGTSPRELRGDRARIALARERLRPADAPAGAQGPALRVEVVCLETFEVVALRRHGAFEALDAGFGALFAWATRAGLVDAIAGLHGVPLGDHRDLPPARFGFDCAIRVDAATPPAPLRRLALPDGPHARVRHTGPYEAIEDTVDRLLRQWWPGSGMALREAPIHYAFLDDPEEVPAGRLRADIHLPLLAVP